MIPDYYVFPAFHGKRVHLGVTGSISAYKALELTRVFFHADIRVSATLTKAGAQFVTPLSFSALGADPCYTDMFAQGMEFPHLEPMSADAFLVAPATANILAKMAYGLADEILSCQLLAYAGPLVVAPAMNPRMWAAAATQRNWHMLLERGIFGVTPQTGMVACGDTGTGRLASEEEIVFRTLAAMSPQDLRGQKIMITLGPTREYFDKARFWSNPSTGRMGAALAVAAALRGAEVTAIQGPVELQLPECITRVPVTSASEMFEAASDIFPSQDVGCFVAAVADFRPPACEQGKFKKDGSDLTLRFATNPDILQTLSSAKKSGQITVGFAAEVENLQENAANKLARKNLDLIVANPIDRSNAGFASNANEVFVLDRNGRAESWPSLSKSEVAWRIWDWTLQNIA